MQFLPSMTCNRTCDTFLLDAPQFLQYYAHHAGKPDFTALEAMRGNTLVKPIFDVDLKLPQEPSPSTIRGAFLQCKDKIADIFAAAPTFDADSQIALATRHGWVVSADGAHQFKLSFHAFVKGFSLRLMDTRALIQTCGDPTYFDLTIYPKSTQAQQLFTLIGGRKKAGGENMMQPLGLTPQGPFSPLDFLAQHLDGSEQVLTFDAQPDVNTSLAVSDLHFPEWQLVVPVLEGAGFGSPVYKGRRDTSLTFTCNCLGKACPCCNLQHDANNWWISSQGDGTFWVKNYSERCKRMLIGAVMTVEDITPITPDTPVEMALSVGLNNMGFPDVHTVVPGECFTLKQHLQTCPTCRLSHALGSSYQVEAIINKCYTVRNEEKHCQKRIISVQTMVEEHEGLRHILDHPNIDGPLADLYVKERGGNLTALDDQVFKFENNRWLRFEGPDLENDVREFLDTVLRGLRDLLHHEDQMLNYKDKRVKKARDNFNIAVGVGESNSKRRQILATIKTQLHNSKLRGKWDSDATLLGLESGVVMLETGEFRPACKEDYVTMSCGYPWLETVDPLIEAEVENFMTSCYPIPEEREFIQRYCYYCLQGVHREKIFLVLNDLRGGWNGKSTFLSLLLATLGDYAIKADPCVLYKQDRTKSINDHSGGLLAFEKKRLMVVDETSAGTVLDEEKLKEWHGSRARVSGRQLHSKEMHEFEWITKLILACNEGKLPHWSVSDEALVSRIATVPHRSRFLFSPLPDEPYTYPVDIHIKDKFPEWRPYMLRWCLKGRLRYQAVGFQEMPAGCLAFKQTLMDDKDVVKEWLELAVEGGDDKDFVKVCDMFAAFSSANRAFQADKKTKKTAKMFEKELHRCLGTDRFKVKHQFKVGGRPTSVGKVFVGLRNAQST